MSDTGCRARRTSGSTNWTGCGTRSMAHNQDWLEWLSCLNDRHVEYLLVGGMALAHHGVPRYTGDLDVLIRPTTENAERVIQALRDFGFGSLDIGVTDLSSRGRVVQLGFPPGRIDLVTSIDGLSWEEADASAEAGRYGTIDTRFIGRAAMIRNKRASGRPQDLADAARLESIDR